MYALIFIGVVVCGLIAAVIHQLILTKRNWK